MLDLMERAAIVQQAGGDETTRQRLFERLWKSYSRRLYFFLLPFAKSETEDRVQDTFMKAFLSIESYRASHAFSTWLYTIGIRVCRSKIRKTQTETFDPTDPLSPEMEEAITPESEAVKLDQHESIRNELKQLSAEDQQLVFLIYSEGLSAKTAAIILDIPEGTVKSRLHYLKLRLKTGLKEVL